MIGDLNYETDGVVNVVIDVNEEINKEGIDFETLFEALQLLRTTLSMSAYEYKKKKTYGRKAREALESVVKKVDLLLVELEKGKKDTSEFELFNKKNYDGEKFEDEKILEAVQKAIIEWFNFDTLGTKQKIELNKPQKKGEQKEEEKE